VVPSFSHSLINHHLHHHHQSIIITIIIVIIIFIIIIIKKIQIRKIPSNLTFFTGACPREYVWFFQKKIAVPASRHPNFFLSPGKKKF
jgi:hypothetical protein